MSLHGLHGAISYSPLSVHVFTPAFCLGLDNQPAMQGLFHQAILGDLNTMAHGLARLSPKYCCDKMRFWGLGRPEAHFWHHNLILVPDSAFSSERDGQPAGMLGIKQFFLYSFIFFSCQRKNVSADKLQS